MNRKYLSLFGLKFSPFTPDLPAEALWRPPLVEPFFFRVTQQVREGGFAMLSGESGLGKSVVLRMLSETLSKVPDVLVGSVSHPQSGLGDFYRELGDLFGVPLSLHNRWNNFKSLRERWQRHTEQCHYRPILLIDEAQEMNSMVLSELKLLSSKELDAKQLLMVILCGDQRLAEKLSSVELMSIGSRTRARWQATPATPEQLGACLEHVLTAAGNRQLMTPGLKRAVCEHAMGNYRAMMGLCQEMLLAQAQREQGPPLDEKLYFEDFPSPVQQRATLARTRRT